jgi:hypothetical protein
LSLLGTEISGFKVSSFLGFETSMNQDFRVMRFLDFKESSVGVFEFSRFLRIEVLRFQGI